MFPSSLGAVDSRLLLVCGRFDDGASWADSGLQRLPEPFSVQRCSRRRRLVSEGQARRQKHS